MVTTKAGAMKGPRRPAGVPVGVGGAPERRFEDDGTGDGSICDGTGAGAIEEGVGGAPERRFEDEGTGDGRLGDGTGTGAIEEGVGNGRLKMDDMETLVTVTVTVVCVDVGAGELRRAVVVRSHHQSQRDLAIFLTRRQPSARRTPNTRAARCRRRRQQR